MEYGASAEDVARVCHAHPVSRYVMDERRWRELGPLGEG